MNNSRFSQKAKRFFLRGLMSLFVAVAVMVSAVPFPAAAIQANTAYFAAYGSDYLEVYKTDGTEAGTALAADINSGGGPSFPENLTLVNNQLFFSATNYSSQYGSTGQKELFLSAGTPETTQLVKDLSTLSDPGFAEFTNVNGVLYFAANDGTHGKELWKSDGTSAGTKMVMDINPNGSSSSSPSYMTVVNSSLFFVADDGVHGAELWKSDALGTRMVKELVSGSGGTMISGITALGNLLVFGADNGQDGIELWISNGSRLGTRMIMDINSGSDGSNPVGFAEMNGYLYFSACDANPDPSDCNSELWRTDGTRAHTTKVKDIRSGASHGSHPSYLVNFNGVIFFSANDGEYGYELWKSDGTDQGTQMVKEINTETFEEYVSAPPYYDYVCEGCGYPSFLTVVGQQLFFVANDGCQEDDGICTGDELYVSDGTTEGTMQVKDINPGIYSTFGTPQGTSFGPELVAFDTLLLFTATNGTNGYELWKSDGTAAGTEMVIDMYSSEPGAAPHYLVVTGY